jgi:hypothetical protein
MANRFTDVVFAMPRFKETVDEEELVFGCTEKQVLTAIAHRLNEENVCWPSYQRIQRDAALPSKSQAIDAVTVLIKLRLLEKEPGSRTVSNRYHLNWERCCVLAGYTPEQVAAIEALSNLKKKSKAPAVDEVDIPTPMPTSARKVTRKVFEVEEDELDEPKRTFDPEVDAL